MKAKNESSEQPVVIIDEFEDIAAEDPTFAGMRSANALEDRYEELKQALLRIYRARTTLSPPQGTRALFSDLNNEIDLPGEITIDRVIGVLDEGAYASNEERQQLLTDLQTTLDALGSQRAS